MLLCWKQVFVLRILCYYLNRNWVRVNQWQNFVKSNAYKRRFFQDSVQLPEKSRLSFHYLIRLQLLSASISVTKRDRSTLIDNQNSGRRCAFECNSHEQNIFSEFWEPLKIPVKLKSGNKVSVACNHGSWGIIKINIADNRSITFFSLKYYITKILPANQQPDQQRSHRSKALQFSWRYIALYANVCS